MLQHIEKMTSLYRYDHIFKANPALTPERPVLGFAPPIALYSPF
jgi:hypothetical protein